MATGFSLFSSAQTIDPLEYHNYPGNNVSPSNLKAAREYLASEQYQKDLKEYASRESARFSGLMSGEDTQQISPVSGIDPYMKGAYRDGDYYVTLWRDGTVSRVYDPENEESFGIKAFKGVVGAALAVASAYVGAGLAGAAMGAAEAGAGVAGVGAAEAGAGAGEMATFGMGGSGLSGTGALGAGTGVGITGAGAGEEMANALLTSGVGDTSVGTGISGFGAGEEAVAGLGSETGGSNALANIYNYGSKVPVTSLTSLGQDGGSQTATAAESAWAVSPEAANAAGATPVAGSSTGVPIGSITANAAGPGFLNSAGQVIVDAAGKVITNPALLATGLNYLVASDAARRAANTQVDAAGNATNAIMTQYWQNRADLAPWREAGVNALAQLVSKVGAGPGEFTISPGYQFRLSEGQKAVERSAAAKGKQLSGATMKALDRYSQDYATSDYDNFLRRYYESLNPLQSLAGVGQTAVTNTAAMGTNAATQNAQNILTAGNAQAGGVINQANALTGAVNSGLNNYLMWKYMNP